MTEELLRSMIPWLKPKLKTAISALSDGNGHYGGALAPLPSARLRESRAANRCRSVYDERCPDQRATASPSL